MDQKQLKQIFLDTDFVHWSGTPDVLSMAQMEKDIAFIAEFTRRMACSAACPVSREMPEKVKTELDEYLNRKRKA